MKIQALALEPAIVNDYHPFVILPTNPIEEPASSDRTPSANAPGTRRKTAPGGDTAPAGLPNGARVVLAPLCGITDAVFRKLCLDQGVEMVVTEMVSSDAMSRGKTERVRSLRGLDMGEGPLSIQIFGADPERMGEILSRMGILDEGDLLRILQLKAEETIYDLFLWNEGNFHFVSDELPDWSITQISLDVTGLIMEGVRRKDEMDMIRQLLPSNRIRLAVSDNQATSANTLEGFDRRLVDLVRQGLTVAEISDHSRAPEFILLRRLYDFVEQGLLRVAEDLSREKGRPDLLTFEECLSHCRHSLDTEDLQAAIDCIVELQGRAANEPGGREALADLERATADLIYSTMISPTHIPTLKRAMEDLVNLKFNAEEGFIVSRIDGVMDINSVIKISPVSEFETLMIFRRLLDEEVIDLTGTGAILPRKS